MKSFSDFLNEAKLKDNKGLPDNFVDTTKQKASRELRVAVDDRNQERQLGGQMMQLIRRSQTLMFAGLNNVEIEERCQQLEELARNVIMSEYEGVLSNVDLDIRLRSSVVDEIPELADQKARNDEDQQRRELKDQEDRSKKDKKDEEPKKDDNKKQSFLDKLMGKGPKKEEKEDFLKSDEYKKGIDKAKLINNVIQGEAKNTKHILHSEMVKSGLREIFGQQKATEIFNVWDELTKTADRMDWAFDIDTKATMMKDHQGNMGGAVKVEWPEAGKKEDEDEDEDKDCPSCQQAEDILKKIEEGEDIEDNKEELGELFSNGNPKIIAVGVDFPMLLHETVKGIYELIAAAYLPSQEASDEEKTKSKVIQMGVSSFEDEAEDFRYGPYIAAALRDFINSCPGWDRYPNMREYVFGEMVLLESGEFLELMKGILNKTDKAKKIISGMISDISDRIREWEVGEIDEPSYEEPDSDDEFPEQGKEEEDEISKLIRQSQEVNSGEDSDDVVDYSKMNRDQLDIELNKAIDSGDRVALDAISKILSMRKESVMLQVYGSEIARLLKS